MTVHPGEVSPASSWVIADERITGPRGGRHAGPVPVAPTFSREFVGQWFPAPVPPVPVPVDPGPVAVVRGWRGAPARAGASPARRRRPPALDLLIEDDKHQERLDLAVGLWSPDRIQKPKVCQHPKKGIRDAYGQEIEHLWCNWCEVCMERRRRDIAGRISAEATMWPFAYFLSATLADRPGDKMLSRSHPDAVKPSRETITDTLTAWRKRQVRSGQRCAWFYAAEYGGRYGRGHYHAVIFSSVEIPEFHHMTFQRHDFWAHGLLSAYAFDGRHAFYVAKYMTKDSFVHAAEYAGARESWERLGGAWDGYQVDLERYDGSHLVMGHTRGLGFGFAEKLGQDLARQGMALHDSTYQTGALTKAGKLHRFRMRNTMLDRYVSAYVAAWKDLRPGQALPMTEYLARRLNKADHQARVDADLGVFDPSAAPEADPMRARFDARRAALQFWRRRPRPETMIETWSFAGGAVLVHARALGGGALWVQHVADGQDGWIPCHDGVGGVSVGACLAALRALPDDGHQAPSEWDLDRLAFEIFAAFVRFGLFPDLCRAVVEWDARAQAP